MYEYFEGVITVVTPSYVVVDVWGIGTKYITAYDQPAMKCQISYLFPNKRFQIGKRRSALRV